MRAAATLALAALLALAGLRAAAETLVADVSQSRIAITANFDGSEILVFGAIRREAPMPDGPPEVIIALEGPSAPATVWRKARRFGIWVNAESVRIGRAPRFYALATTGPLEAILSATEDLRHRISIPRAIRAVGMAGTEDAPAFLDALIRLRSAADHYQLREGAVVLAGDTLFHTRIALPADLTEGRFAVRIYLLRDGAVVDRTATEIEVQKVGIERFLFRLAHDQPLVYGALALLIAIAAGWAASEAFRRLRA